MSCPPWMSLVFAIVVLAACSGSDGSGVCDVCQDRAASCIELTPGIASLEGGVTERELFRCYDRDRNEIECICCNDPGQPACDPPLCDDGLTCLSDTNGTQRCWEFSSPGIIDGVCTASD